MERPETLDAKVSGKSVARLDLKDKCDAVASFDGEEETSKKDNYFYCSM
jgi:hypothetical protein